MRIIFLSWRDTTHPDGGGAERYLEEIARRLAAGGDDVTIVCAAHDGAASDETVAGIRFRRRGGRLSVYPRGLLYVLGRSGRRADVVVDVINGVPFAARLVRRRGLVALVHHLHREQWQLIYPGLLGRIGWFVESRCALWLYRGTAFVAVSETTRRDLIRLGVDAPRVRVIRNAVSTSGATAPRSPTPRVCVLSRLVPHKRIEEALGVVASLRQEFGALHLDVVGSGWWHDELVSHCRDLGLVADVTFHGHLPDAERDRVLARAWVMLAPSVKEGWAIAVLEAAMAGTPTIAYRFAGGVTESIVDEHTGLLADDQAGLTELTRRVLADPDLRRRLGDAAAARARGFDWADTAQQFRETLACAAKPVSGRRTGRSGPTPGCAPEPTSRSR